MMQSKHSAPAERHTLDHIERFNQWVGDLAAWLLVGVVLLQASVVLLRFMFGIGMIALQDAVIYLHGATFMLAIASVLSRDGHVRIDVFFKALSPYRRNIVELLSALLCVFPFAIATFYISLPYVARSWKILEGSRDISGLPIVFIIKTLIPVSSCLIAAQAIVLAAKAMQGLRQAQPTPQTTHT